MDKKIELEFQKTSHASYSKWYVTTYVNRATGILKEVSVHRDSWGYPTSKTKTEYFLPGSRKAFKSEKDVIAALNQQTQLKTIKE